MLTMKKIFLIGSERSGTNLLRVLLGNHSRISAPPPIHLLDLFESRTGLASDSARGDNLISGLVSVRGVVV